MIGAQQDFSYMDDRALQTALQFAQRANDTPTFLALSAEANKRKKLRMAAQGAQAGQETAAAGPTTVADQVMSGIANLSSGEHEYAGGGIVSFADGGTPGIKYGTYGLPKDSPKVLPERTGYEGMSIGELLASLKNSAVNFFENGPGSYNSRTGKNFVGINEGANAVRKSDMAPPTTEPVSENAVVRRAMAGEPAPNRPPVPVRAAAPSGIAAVAAAQKEKTTETSKPAAPTYVEPKILTAAEQRAADEALAKGDNDKVDAIFAAAKERDAKRREELDSETKGKKGWLGAEMSPETRKMLRDAGIAMLTSKDPSALGGIGAGLKAASEGYEAGVKRRQERLDLLDAAEEKRQLAIMAAKQGNTALANKYSTQENDLREKAAGRALERDKMSADERHRQELLKVQREQIAATLKGHAMSAANAGRNQQIEFYSALGGGDPKKGYEFAQTSKGNPAMDRTVMAQMLKDPELRTSNPALYNYILSQLYGSGPGAVTSTPTGNVLK